MPKSESGLILAIAALFLNKCSASWTVNVEKFLQASNDFGKKV
jgi:hypothetical protein